MRLGERIVDLDGELPAGVFASASRSDDRLCVHLVNTTTIPQDVTLTVDLPLVMSNHPDLAELAAFYDVPFESHPVASAGQKLSFEDRVQEVVEQHDIELVVLARYMQILSPQLCDALGGRIINIHHSFLPGFKGASPYRQAHARGQFRYVFQKV